MAAVAGARPVALITGAGVGAATSVMLASRGYDIAAAYHTSAEGASATASCCREEGADAVTIARDVSRDADCRAMVEQVVARSGGFDASVNNAGATIAAPMEKLDALSIDHFTELTAINVAGPFQLTRAAAPHLAAAQGAVVNVSSLSSLTGRGSSIAYAASKAALNTLTLALARILAAGAGQCGPAGRDRHAMDVRTVGEEAFERTKRQMGSISALGGVSTSEDVADAIVWLLHARAMTGELIRIDAGQTLGR